MNEEVKIKEKVELHNAVMVMGLRGWGNAGEVSTFTVKYLVDKLGAKKFGEILSERFHDYFIQRPIVLIRGGIIQSYISPRNDLFYWRKKEDNVDMVLLLGYEPHLNWSRYAKAVLGLAKETSVDRIYTIGGYLADISHEADIPITASTNNKKLIAELKKVGFELTDYEGQTSVYSEMLWKARRKKIDVVSLWCAVPMYVSRFYPKAAYHMLESLTQLMGIKLDLKDLEKKAESFKSELEREAMTQPELRELMEDLRRRRGKEKEPTYIL